MARRGVPPITTKKFVSQMIRNLIIGFVIISIFLGLGMIGYHHFENMTWVEAFENAAMILSGEGPVDKLNTDGGKIFAGIYGLFCGIIFLLVIAIIIAPIVERFLHKYLLRDRR